MVKTDRLPRVGQAARTIAPKVLREIDIKIPEEWKDPEQLGQKDYRLIIDDIVSPTSRITNQISDTSTQAMAVGEKGYSHPIKDVVVSRRRQHAIEIRLAHGDITEADARSYVMGIYKGVEPAGAAAAIDERLDGASEGIFNTSYVHSGCW